MTPSALWTFLTTQLAAVGAARDKPAEATQASCHPRVHAALSRSWLGTGFGWHRFWLAPGWHRFWLAQEAQGHSMRGAACVSTTCLPAWADPAWADPA